MTDIIQSLILITDTDHRSIRTIQSRQFSSPRSSFYNNQNNGFLQSHHNPKLPAFSNNHSRHPASSQCSGSSQLHCQHSRITVPSLDKASRGRCQGLYRHALHRKLRLCGLALERLCEPERLVRSLRHPSTRRYKYGRRVSADEMAQCRPHPLFPT